MEQPGIIIEEYGDENWKTYQPDASVVLLEDYIQIRFTKKAADAVNIYKRQSETESWEFIATAVNSPFDDHESEGEWKYCIRGIKNNVEVGLPLLLSVHSNHSA